jgi:hypothetical protein
MKMGKNGCCNNVVADDRTYCNTAGHYTCEVLLNARNDYSAKGDSFGTFLCANILDECVTYSNNPLQPVKCERFFNRDFVFPSNFAVLLFYWSYLWILQAPLGIFLSGQNAAIDDQENRARTLANMYLQQLRMARQPSHTIVLLDGHGALLLLVMYFIWKESGENEDILNSVHFQWPDTEGVVTTWHETMFPCRTIICSRTDIFDLILSLKAKGETPVPYLNFCGLKGQLMKVIDLLDSLCNSSSSAMNKGVLVSFSVVRSASGMDDNFKKLSNRPACTWTCDILESCGRDNVFVTCFITAKSTPYYSSSTPSKHISSFHTNGLSILNL